MASLTYMLAVSVFIVSYYPLPLVVLGKSKDCPPSRCSKDGPVVRYPFRLETQAVHCGYDTLVLSCSGGDTVLTLPHSGDYNVTAVDYKNAVIEITRHSWTPNCPWFHITEPNITGSLFTLAISVNTSWFECPDILTSFSEDEYLAGPISCLSSEGHFIYLTHDNTIIDEIPSTCLKTRNTSKFTSAKVLNNYEYFEFSSSGFRNLIRDFEARPVMSLLWKDDLINCSTCEKKRWHRCEFDLQTKRPHCRDSHTVLKAGASSGVASIILLGGLIVFLVHRQFRKKRTTRRKVEHFLRSYRVMNPTRYAYEDLKRITNRFKKIIGSGAFGTVYRGELPNGIPVAVKMLHRSAGGGELFINEVATIGRIHHVHVVRLLGFCSEGAKHALVYEFMENGSLDKYIFSVRWRNNQFSMEEMLGVAMGIAEGIEYLHQGCDQRIVHFDIKPHNILLDHNLVPKISDFGLSRLCPKDQSYLTISAARGTMGYLAPEMYSRNFGVVSYKSDVYSFGMLILEMISRRKNIDPLRGDQSGEVYFPEWIHQQLVLGKDLCLVPDVGGNEEIAKKLAIVALWCIQWSPEDRPSMTRIVQMLGENLQNLQIPINPITPSNCDAFSGQSS